ncbi:MAG: AAA family ATPase [Gemmatimonadaceae bacterium]
MHRTFRRRELGTLFLDEIGTAGQGVQRKLLQIIETGALRPVCGLLILTSRQHIAVTYAGSHDAAIPG